MVGVCANLFHQFAEQSHSTQPDHNVSVHIIERHRHSALSVHTQDLHNYSTSREEREAVDDAAEQIRHT